jgi:hypothetical protein
MMLKSKHSMPTGILETIIVGIPRVAKAMEELARQAALVSVGRG